MSKSNSTVPETPSFCDIPGDGSVDPYYESIRKELQILQNKQLRLNTEKLEREAKASSNIIANETLRDKMEAARRNIAELRNVCSMVLGKDMRDNECSNIYEISLRILAQNIEVLSEINKFKI